MIIGGEGCNIPSLTEHTYRSITRLGLKRLSARNCNCSQVSSSFLQKFQSTLQKLDLSCNPLRHSFANIVTGISNSNLSVLLLDNINRIPKPGELYCPWNITSANLRPLKNAPLKIFSFHSNQLGDYGDLKLQLYAPGLIYLDVSYNNFHGPTNLLVVDTNKGEISHNSSLAHHITYQPLGLKYVGLRGLITTTPPCGIPPKYRIHCNDDSYLFLDDKFYWDANHEPDIVDFRLLRDIRRAYLKSGKSLGMIYSCTKAGNSLHRCFQSYPTQALSLLPCLSGLEQCFSNDDIQQLSRCFQGQNNEFCGATFLFSNQHVVSCSKQNFDLPNTSLLELLQFYTSCLKDAGGTCSSMAPSILRKLKFKECLVKELTELSVHRRSNGLPTFHDDRLINETVYKLIIIDSSKIAFNVTQNIGYIPPNITTLSFGDNRFWESGGVTLTHLNRSCVNRTFYRNNLETADLSHTSLDFVLCRNIRGFPYLTNVTCNYAELTGWHKDILAGIPVKYVHLKGVKGIAHHIQNDEYGEAFSSVPGLEVLDISDIGIKHISNSQILANHPNLTHLYLQNNNLGNWNISINKNLALKTLDLRHNRVENIEKQFRAEIEQQVRSNQLKVYLEGNNVDCSDCSSDYITWLLRSGAITDHHKIRCKSYYLSTGCLLVPFCTRGKRAVNGTQSAPAIADSEIAAIVVGLTVILALVAIIVVSYNHRHVLVFKLSQTSGDTDGEDLMTSVYCCHSSDFNETINGMYGSPCIDLSHQFLLCLLS